ncbi:MAG: hypothetical protein P0Y55_08520 [Candidatus Cohnella colombiensis]|uniref:Uncharacterized protein n=1 Tax=Candidatus Cohnella colombiensis TaxID=3121368 RepID=A0AA95JD91_9BACL|nr:MAG: hypothetical protein P0Y55_08520 [Cohnella sp.]
MNSERFSEIIKELRDESIESTYTFFIKPPGRKPRKRHVELSNWLNALDDKDKVMLREFIKEGIDASLFGLLCIFDGVRKVKAGEFKLSYIEEGREIKLNESEKVDLHDLYNHYFKLSNQNKYLYVTQDGSNIT